MDTKTVSDLLGHCARMISGSKSGYRAMYPASKPVFNANVCTEQGKIWYGDLDLADPEDVRKLQQLANVLETKIYVLSEMDARFENEDKPRLERAVTTFVPNP
jgi:hypothetical protein